MGRQCSDILNAVKFIFSSGRRFEYKYFSNWYVSFILWYISILLVDQSKVLDEKSYWMYSIFHWNIFSFNSEELNIFDFSHLNKTARFSPLKNTKFYHFDPSVLMHVLFNLQRLYLQGMHCIKYVLFDISNLLPILLHPKQAQISAT